MTLAEMGEKILASDLDDETKAELLEVLCEYSRRAKEEWHGYDDNCTCKACQAEQTGP
ncbi:MAG: hypothetical protein AB1401_00655 [Thermodesulfobacteriota bacterium]